jgi:hypothetical protein
MKNIYYYFAWFYREEKKWHIFIGHLAMYSGSV